MSIRDEVIVKQQAEISFLKEQLNGLYMLKAIEGFTPKYEFSFQFWGEGQNNVYINKDFVEIASFGGETTINDILKRTLEYLYRINKTPLNERCF